MESSSLKRVTTIEGMSDKITYKRRDGNTTRLVDNAIQILFKGHICVVLDHYQRGRHRDSNERLFKEIMRRLDAEHRWLFEERRLKIDRNKLEIHITEKSQKETLKLGTGVSLNGI